MLEGQGLEIFRGDVKKWAVSYRKKGDIQPVIKNDIPEKPHGVASTPHVPAIVKMVFCYCS